MLVRIQSRLGVARVTIPANATVAELKNKIEEQCQVSSSNQTLNLRGAQGVIRLTPDSERLSSFSIKNGELIYLESPETSLSEEDIKKAKQEAEVSAKAHQGDRSSSQSGETANYASSDVREDDIDIILRKQDGWVQRPRSRFCNHPTDGKCSNCMAIAPWNVQNHEEFSNLNLKHIAFHAWLREKEYHSPNNPVFLEDPTWRIDDADKQMVSARQSAWTVLLERQPYRHVDHIEFESPSMLDKFIDAWRSTGKQRCGYLYGKYIQEPSGIPLGISAVVCAIYEPPQKGTVDEVLLLKDNNESKIDQIAASLGLVRVGFIWTALRVDQQRKIIPDRDINEYALTSNECYRIASLQNKYPSPCRQSNTGKFGSKFVSVLLYGNEEGNIETAAYQVSNQVARLVRDGVVRPTKQNPGFLRVRQSTNETLYPDVVYSHKNEYGYLVQSKADPTFPNDFAIVSVRHSFPKNPNPLFKLVNFPIENRTPNTPNPNNLQSALQGKNSAAYVSIFSDFHLIIYVASNIPALLPTLSKLISKSENIYESHLRPLVDEFLKKSQPAQKQPAASTSSSLQTGAGGSSSSVLPAKGQEILKQLMAMGYEEKQASEAVWATGSTSVESALALLLES